MINTSPVAIAATFSLVAVLCAPSAWAGNTLYQWVDGRGNVMYGDSPPALSSARKLGSGEARAQLVAPIAPEIPPPQSPTVPLVADVQTNATPEPDARDAALEAALAKLDVVMKQVSELSGQLQDTSQQRSPARSALAAAKVEIAPTPVLGAQPLLEVAMPEAQPIESRLSERERDRSRWDAESLGQRRFLERLGNIAPPVSPQGE
jgi:hypothetical protein